jgi:hypothetical protein
MKRLHAYRYAASNYARGKIEPEKIKKAYTELTNFKSEKVANGMADLNKIKEEIKSRKEIFDFADEDIPNCPIPLRRFYEKLMKLLHGYFKSHSQLLEFVEIRTHIKKELNQENTDGKNSSC